MEAKQFLQNCNKLRILVVGDLILDRYTWGRVNRISPEAPVPVVDVFEKGERLGGAANVAHNLQAMGAQVALCGVIGQDHAGHTLLKLAKEHQFDTSLILQSDERRTTTKTRIFGNGQQVLRLDKEDRHYLPRIPAKRIIRRIDAQLASFDGIIFEDYDKGFLSPLVIRSVIQAAHKHQIFLAADPKFEQFLHYYAIDLFKPNRKELAQGLKLTLPPDDLPSIIQASQKLRKKMPHLYTLVTLSEQGVLFIDAEDTPKHLPAHKRSITDVSGAGDTVISVMTLALLAGVAPIQAAQFANLAGGLVCEEVGVVPIDAKRWLDECERLG